MPKVCFFLKCVCLKPTNILCNLCSDTENLLKPFCFRTEKFGFSAEVQSVMSTCSKTRAPCRGATKLQDYYCVNFLSI